MSSRAVTNHTNPGDQQKWSTPYLCAIRVVVVVFVVMAVSSLWAQISTTRRHRRCCYRSNSGCDVWRLCNVEERRHWKLQFHNNQFARIVQFSFSTTWKLFGLGERCRISTDRKECDCRAGGQRYGELADVHLIGE